HSQYRMEKQTEAVDGQEEKLEQALLDECKPLLRNILIHWEPKEKEVSCSKPEPFTTDEPESSDLDDATACLILKWALKSLTESPYDDSSTLAILKWVISIIPPRTRIVDAILMDEGIRKDFLRLYHQTCEHAAEEHRSAMDTLQLFSRVMLQLLEAHSTSLNGVHQTVIRTCLPTNTDDGAKKGKVAIIQHNSPSQSFPLWRNSFLATSVIELSSSADKMFVLLTEAGLKLLSLYIYELWSGARSPDLLLTHARLLCNRTGFRKHKSHILHICKDILSAVDS
ncbi:hypothetical protein M9458_029689, partial [Cirrhinus mrigala]